MAKIKKIKLGSVEYDIKDPTTVDTINGYSYSEINNGTIQFANQPITSDEIDGLFAASTSEGDKK